MRKLLIGIVVMSLVGSLFIFTPTDVNAEWGIEEQSPVVDDYEIYHTQLYYDSCSFSSLANAVQAQLTDDDRDAAEMEQHFVDEHGDHHPLDIWEMMNAAENETGRDYAAIDSSDYTADELLDELSDQLYNHDWSVPFLVYNEDIKSLSDSSKGHWMNVIHVDPETNIVAYHDGNYHYDYPEVYYTHINLFKDAVDSYTHVPVNLIFSETETGGSSPGDGNPDDTY